jgi:hypothetical protein
MGFLLQVSEIESVGTGTCVTFLLMIRVVVTTRQTEGINIPNECKNQAYLTEGQTPKTLPTNPQIQTHLLPMTSSPSYRTLGKGRKD